MRPLALFDMKRKAHAPYARTAGGASHIHVASRDVHLALHVCCEIDPSLRAGPLAGASDSRGELAADELAAHEALSERVPLLYDSHCHAIDGACEIAVVTGCFHFMAGRRAAHH